MRKMKTVYKILLENLKRSDHLGDLRVDWVTISKINYKQIGHECVEWIHMAETGPLAGSCEHGNGPTDSIKDEFLHYLCDYQKHSGPRF
jgi:hypothetical protein